jgi:hypothetical protein
MVGTAAGIAQAGVAFLGVVVTLGIAYDRVVIRPVKEEASNAMSTAETAKQKAEDNRESIDSLGDDIRESIEYLVESEKQGRRERRGQTYQIYQLANAINETEEMPDVPVPDEDDFLRGGSERKAEFEFGTD